MSNEIIIYTCFKCGEKCLENDNLYHLNLERVFWGSHSIGNNSFSGYLCDSCAKRVKEYLKRIDKREDDE